VITVARVWFGLAAFLVVTGAIYGITSHELAGAPLLLVGSVTFFYLGIVARGRVRDASRPGGDGHAPDEASEAEAHVAPTIWPFGFSIAAVMLALGLVVSRWLLAAGGVLFLLAAVGWFRDVARQHQHADRP
jgi:Cytochrome c oxidase subunit IV